MSLRELYEAKRYDEAAAHYAEASRHPADGHLYGALSLWHEGRYGSAQLAARDGLKTRVKGETRVKLLHLLGVCSIHSGDWSLAQESIDGCMQELESHPNLAPVLRGVCLYNLGLVHEYKHGAPESQRQALSVYRLAEAEFERENLTDYLRMCRHNMAWVACELEDFDTAISALDKADKLCVTEESRRRQNLTHAALLVAQGSCAEALSILGSSVDENAGVPLDLVIIARVVSAKAALGLLDKGPRMAEAAVALARSAYEAVMRNQGQVDHRCYILANRQYMAAQKVQMQKEMGA